MLAGCASEKGDNTNTSNTEEENINLSTTLTLDDIDGFTYYPFSIDENTVRFFGEETPFTYELPEEDFHPTHGMIFDYYKIENDKINSYHIEENLKDGVYTFYSVETYSHKIIEINNRYFSNNCELVIGDGIISWDLNLFVTEDFINKNDVEKETVHTQIEEWENDAQIMIARTELEKKIKNDFPDVVVNKNQTYELPKSIEIMYHGQKCVINLSYSDMYSYEQILLSDYMLTFVDGYVSFSLNCQFTCSNGYCVSYTLFINSYF